MGSLMSSKITFTSKRGQASGTLRTFYLLQPISRLPEHLDGLQVLNNVIPTHDNLRTPEFLCSSRQIGTI